MVGIYNVVSSFVVVEGRKERKEEGVEDCLNTHEFRKAAYCSFSKLAQGPHKFAACKGR